MSVERIEVPASPEVVAAWKSHFTEETKGDDGMTTAELAVLAGIPDRSMARRVRDGLRDGTYAKGKGYREDAAGRRQRVPVYRLAEKR